MSRELLGRGQALGARALDHHADPRTTRRYDRARHRLDRDPALILSRVLG